MADETWAILETEIGPLPAGVTWDNETLDTISTRVADVVHAANVELAADKDLGDAQAGTSGMIRGIHRGDDIGAGGNRPSVEEILTHIGHYTSTYCVHSLHDQCRWTCKHCGKPCRCHCHDARTEAVP